jgi:hypothetical protein
MRGASMGRWLLVLVLGSLRVSCGTGVHCAGRCVASWFYSYVVGWVVFEACECWVGEV